MTHEAIIPLLGKIKRAKTHITDLQTAVRAFYNSRPYEILPQINVDGTELVWRFVIEPFPDDIDCIAADAIHNLRVPLDKMLTIGAASSIIKHIAFPVGDDLNHFKSLIAKQAHYLPGPVIKFLEDTKPYIGGNGAWIHALHHLDRHDKHHSILTPIKLGLRATNFNQIGVTDGDLLIMGSRRGKHMIPHVDSITGQRAMVAPSDDLRPVYRQVPPWDKGYVEFTAPYDDMDVITTTVGAKAYINVEPSLDVAFSEFEVIEREPAINALHKMLDVVQGLVERYEAKFL